MGPQPAGCGIKGNLPRRNGSWQLQWGRSLQAAELKDCIDIISRTERLQWGRSLQAAEFYIHSIRH